MVTSEQMKRWWSLNKNSPQTKERNKKISEHHRGWNHTDEAKEKMREARLGKTMSEEAKHNMSVFMKGHKFSEEHNKKISQYHKGRSKSIQHRNSLSISKKKGWKNISAEEYWGHDRRGENNPNYIDGQSMEDYVGFTRKFKKLIKKRDNYVCMNCGTHSEKIRLCVHHIDRDKTNSIPENCITLCITCHNLTLKNNEYWMELFQNKLTKYYGYEYINNLPVIKLNIKEEVKEI